MPYQDILLWGHSYQDFINMFGLTPQDLSQKILDFHGGPNSFNAECTQQGGQVISCDPLFSMPPKELQAHIDNVFAEMLLVIETHKDRFIWDKIKSPSDLAKIRKNNINIFLKDYPIGLNEKRYLSYTLPTLEFNHQFFDIALCSHFLFANCPDQSVDFHVIIIKELCRVAGEARIFPLLDSHGEISKVVGPVMQRLFHEGLGVEIKSVPYEFQKKGNAMLRVWLQKCEV